MIALLLSLGFVVQALASEPISPILGPQRTAVILVDLLNDGQAQPRSEIEEAFFSGSHSVSRLIEEASYGKASVQGAVFGWYSVPHRSTECYLMGKEAFDLIQSKLDLRSFDRYVFLFHTASENCRNYGFGMSSLGKEWVDTSDGPLFVSTYYAQLNHRLSRPVLPYQPLTGISSSVLAHEFGHSLGIRAHSNLLDCGPVTASTEPCKQEGIADLFTVMGGEGFFHSSLHFSACHKEDLGWLTAPDLITISDADLNTPRELTLAPYEALSPWGFPIVLTISLTRKIPVATVTGAGEVSISKLYVEYRKPQGFDRNLAELSAHPAARFSNLTGTSQIDIGGVQIRGGFFADGHCVTSYLFDTHPESLTYAGESYSLYDHLDAFLLTGETFHEPLNGLEIQTLGFTDDGNIRIRISRRTSP